MSRNGGKATTPVESLTCEIGDKNPPAAVARDVCYIPRMASGIRIVAALAVALLAVAFAAESSPARTEFAAEAFAQGKKFVSKKYGYEIVLPAGRYQATTHPSLATTPGMARISRLATVA
jgi:hypothetical protein